MAIFKPAIQARSLSNTTEIFIQDKPDSPMLYLIDGHNLIPRIPGIHLQDLEDEIQLIKMLQDYCRATRSKVEVFFDNAPTGSIGVQHHGRLTAHFILQGRTADDAIRSRLKKLGRSARNWTVVSSDREIAAAARESGARVYTAEQFAAKVRAAREDHGISPEKDENPDLSAPAIEEWLELFQSGKKET
jgi:hypothetical protein